MIPRLKEAYSKKIQPALKESLGLKNIFMTPKVVKVVLNMGLGLDGADAKVLKACEEDMSKITGQRPVVTKFKKSVANFKTRKGTNAGLKVTFNPALVPFLVLKLATDFLNFVTIGFCPVIFPRSSSVDFIILASAPSRPRPILITTLTSFGP